MKRKKNGHYYVIELKASKGGKNAERTAETAIRRIREKGYADKYAGMGATLVGIGVDNEARRVGGVRIEKY